LKGDGFNFVLGDLSITLKQNKEVFVKPVIEDELYFEESFPNAKWMIGLDNKGCVVDLTGNLKRVYILVIHTVDQTFALNLKLTNLDFFKMLLLFSDKVFDEWCNNLQDEQDECSVELTKLFVEASDTNQLNKFLDKAPRQTIIDYDEKCIDRDKDIELIKASTSSQFEDGFKVVTKKYKVKQNVKVVKTDTINYSSFTIPSQPGNISVLVTWYANGYTPTYFLIHDSFLEICGLQCSFEVRIYIKDEFVISHNVDNTFERRLIFLPHV
jgi:hypothetical protein